MRLIERMIASSERSMWCGRKVRLRNVNPNEAVNAVKPSRAANETELQQGAAEIEGQLDKDGQKQKEQERRRSSRALRREV